MNRKTKQFLNLASFSVSFLLLIIHLLVFVSICMWKGNFQSLIPVKIVLSFKTIQHFSFSWIQTFHYCCGLIYIYLNNNKIGFTFLEVKQFLMVIKADSNLPGTLKSWAFPAEALWTSRLSFFCHASCTFILYQKETG